MVLEEIVLEVSCQLFVVIPVPTVHLVVFGDPPQSTFAAASFGACDGNVQPYGTEPSSSTTLSIVMTPSTSKSRYFTRSKTLFVIFGTLRLQLFDEEVKQMDAFLEEGSGPNKRAHIEFILQLSSQ